jgi:hypothetical protein
VWPVRKVTEDNRRPRLNRAKVCRPEKTQDGGDDDDDDDNDEDDDDNDEYDREPIRTC